MQITCCQDLYCYLLYFSSGINQWRDQLKPSQILENLARLKGLSKPKTEDNGASLTFNGKDYTLAQFGNCNCVNECIYINDSEVQLKSPYTHIVTTSTST